MNRAVDMLELVLQDGYKTKGWEWVQSEPLWMTWPLEKFGKLASFSILEL